MAMVSERKLFIPLCFYMTESNLNEFGLVRVYKVYQHGKTRQHSELCDTDFCLRLANEQRD